MSGRRSGAEVPRNPVASGSYVVSGHKQEILEAYLGTCVGVTLSDRHANVGGLLHLLLPEPTGVDRVLHPEKYASTGLPLFIEAVFDAGASRDNLEACFAGGALVRPLSERDLILDIGGRTAEAVERILRRERIPIVKAETGGFFTCSLSLNLQTWETEIQPMGMSLYGSSAKEFERPGNQQIDRTLQNIQPIPQIAMKILRMMNEREHSLQELSKEIRKDQVLTAKILSLCNSAFFSPRIKIDSIDRALVMLGEKRFLQMVVSASLGELYPQSAQGYSLCKGGLFQHALGTAVLAEKLAAFTGKAPAGTAYTAGLLHDIGKVVLDQYVASAWPFFYRRTQINGVSLIVVEQEVFGITHPEVGNRLAQNWSLPENLAEVIAHHHNPERGTIHPELTHLVYLADLLMSRFIVGQELEWLNTDDLPARLKRVGLTTKQFPMIIDSIPQQLFRVPYETESSQLAEASS